jgi:hypothetical protein
VWKLNEDDNGASLAGLLMKAIPLKTHYNHPSIYQSTSGRLLQTELPMLLI